MFKGQKGQVMIYRMMILVMSILVLSAFIPMLKTTIDDARGQNSLNCASSTLICGKTVNDTTTRCYNSSKDKEVTACLALDLYIPYIVLAVIIGGVGYLLARGMFDSGGQQQQGYGGY